MTRHFNQYWYLGMKIIFGLGVAWIIASVVPDSITQNRGVSAPHTGFLAPEFSLQSMDEGTHTLSDYQGQAVLVNFWASWCPPCRAEMTDMEKVYQDYKGQGFVILAVNSTIQDTKSDAVEFVQDNNLSFEIIFDNLGEATKAYQITALPTSFFIDREGIIREVIVGGPMPEALLRERIERLLGEE